MSLGENIDTMSHIYLNFPYMLQIQFMWWSTHLLSLFTLSDSPLDSPSHWAISSAGFQSHDLKAGCSALGGWVWS